MLSTETDDSDQNDPEVFRSYRKKKAALKGDDLTIGINTLKKREMEIKKEIHELKQQVLGQQLNQMTAMTNAHHAQYPSYHVERDPRASPFLPPLPPIPSNYPHYGTVHAPPVPVSRSINNFNAHFGEVSTMFPQMSQVPQQVAAPELVSAFRQQQEQIRELQSQINQENRVASSLSGRIDSAFEGSTSMPPRSQSNASSGNSTRRQDHIPRPVPRQIRPHIEFGTRRVIQTRPDRQVKRLASLIFPSENEQIPRRSRTNSDGDRFNFSLDNLTEDEIDFGMDAEQFMENKSINN